MNSISIITVGGWDGYRVGRAGGCAALTFCLLLVLPVGTDFEDALDARAWGILLGGDIERDGISEDGPGSGTGDLRWSDLCVEAAVCISIPAVSYTSVICEARFTQKKDAFITA